MSLKIKPYSENNAIKTVAFGFEFSRGFEPDELNTLHGSHEKIKTQLPTVSPHEAIQVKFEVEGGKQVASQSTLSGFTYSSGEEHANDWKLIIRDNQLIAVCEDYTTWSEVSVKALSILQVFLAEIAKLEAIQLVSNGLQYVDEFIVLDDSPGWTRDLFREGGGIVPGFVHDTNELWHSHNGYFSHQLGDKTKILNILNFTLMLEQDSTKKLALMTQHKVLKENAEFDGSLSENYGHEVEVLHKLNIDVMKEAFSQTILKEIGMEI